jgi:hypothetical protein
VSDSPDFIAEIARLRAEADQTREHVKELGSTIYAFYESLTAAGFDSDQALALTQTWLSQLLNGAAAANVMTSFIEGLSGGDSA